MKTLYKSSRLIAAAIVGSLVLSAGAAVALTTDAHRTVIAADAKHINDLGRFEVTPTKQTHIESATASVSESAILGRFVVTRSNSVFVPAA